MTTQAPGFVRRMDPSRDLATIADLIEDAFQLKQDPEGQILVQNMRHQARLFSGSSGSFLDRLVARAYWSDGLVWEHEGKVVGNITLIPHAKGMQHVVMIANVSVHEDYRRLGIAHELTLQGLERCRNQGVREVYLQVRHDNEGAIKLYHQLDFQTLHSVSQWRLRQSNFRPSMAELENDFEINHRRFSDWGHHKVWLAEAYPEETRWYADLSFGALSSLAWINPFSWGRVLHLDHYALHHKGKLMGILSWQRREAQIDSLWLALPPGLELQDESARAEALLRHFVTELWNRGKVNLEFPMGRATQGIQNAGFVLAHDLDWMALQLA